MQQKEPDLAGDLRLITEKFAEKFDRYREILLFYNKKFNLTSIVGEKEILYKHFLDSVAGEFLFPQNASVAEVGSGAGFPSLPLKIVRGDLTFSLFESTAKKCEFLRVAVRELELEGTEVFCCRAEEAARGAFREKFDVCCARAVARMNTLAEYCLPFVKKGGSFIAYKGNAEEEIAEAERAISLLGGGKPEVTAFSLPEQAGERMLVRVEKKRETPLQYPRGRGKERSAPIL